MKQAAVIVAILLTGFLSPCTGRTAQHGDDLKIVSVGFKIVNAGDPSVVSEDFASFEAILVDTKTDLELGNISSFSGTKLARNVTAEPVYFRYILSNLGCTPQKRTGTSNVIYQGPCKYQTLWIDPEGDGSPNGRELMKALAVQLAKSNAAKIVPTRNQAQAAFYFQHEQYHQPQSASNEWSSVSWKAVVENHTDRRIRLMGRIKFLDSDGYMVDGDVFTGYIGGGQERTFTGQVPMPDSDSNRISSANAEITDYY